MFLDWASKVPELQYVKEPEHEHDLNAIMPHYRLQTNYMDFTTDPPLSPGGPVTGALDRARALLQEGKNAGEAGYLVGYNSPAQFSREYKRHFGFPPRRRGGR
jgi:hypothetical protein